MQNTGRHSCHIHRTGRFELKSMKWGQKAKKKAWSTPGEPPHGQNTPDKGQAENPNREISHTGKYKPTKRRQRIQSPDNRQEGEQICHGAEAGNQAQRTG